MVYVAQRTERSPILPGLKEHCANVGDLFRPCATSNRVPHSREATLSSVSGTVEAAGEMRHPFPSPRSPGSFLRRWIESYARYYQMISTHPTDMPNIFLRPGEKRAFEGAPLPAPPGSSLDALGHHTSIHSPLKLRITFRSHYLLVVIIRS